MQRTFIAAVAVVLFAAYPAFGDLIISAPNVALPPGLGKAPLEEIHEIDVTVTATAGEQTAGNFLVAQIFGPDPKPALVYLDAIGPGTIFGPNNNTATQRLPAYSVATGITGDAFYDLDGVYAPGGGTEPMMGGNRAFEAATFTTQSGTIPANGLLMRLGVDVSGLGPGDGPWTIAFGGTDWGDTQLFDSFGGIMPAQFQNGQIQIIPEPSTFVLLAMGLLVLPVCWWRRKRA